MTRPIASVAFAIVALVWGSPGFSQIPIATSEDPEPAEASVALPERGQIEADLERIEREVALAEEAATDTNAQRLQIPLSELRSRVDSLNAVKNLLEQQQTSLARHEELSAAMADLEQEIEAYDQTGLAEELPYSLEFADGLRDGADAALSASERLGLALGSAGSEVESARERLDAAERDERLAGEALANNTDPNLAPALEAELSASEISKRQADQSLRLKTLRLGVTELENELSRRRAEHLDEIATSAFDLVVFGRTELDENLAALAVRRDEAERDLPRLRNRQQADEARRSEAREALQSAQGEAEITRKTDMLETRTAWAETRLRAVELAEKSVELLDFEKQFWERRFAVAGGKDDETLGLWNDETEVTVEILSRDRRVQEARVLELRTVILDLAKTIQNLEPGDFRAQSMPARLEALQERQQVVEEYLAGLILVERLASRLRAEIDLDYSQVSFKEGVVRVKTMASYVWNKELAQWGGQTITISKILSAIFVLVFGLWGLRLVMAIFRHRILTRMRITVNAAAAIEKVVYYVAILLIIIFALNVVNIPLTLFAFLGGSVAIAVGFGAQHIINNFISGIILMIERPIRIGDLIELEGTYGHIQEIGARSTRVLSPSNIHLIVPNSRLLENTVINWTLSDDKVRTDITIGVVYGTPVRDVESILVRVCQEHSKVLKNPEPIVLFTDFGDNALVFQVYFWVRMRRMMDRRMVESELRFEVDRECNNAGIVIAFPQRDVHLDSTSPFKVQMVPPPSSDSSDPTKN